MRNLIDEQRCNPPSGFVQRRVLERIEKGPVKTRKVVRYVQTSIRSEAAEKSFPEAHAWTFAQYCFEFHRELFERIEAPNIFVREINTSHFTCALCENVLTIAEAIARASFIDDVTANNDGPEPEREHPVAPALSAAFLTS
jgi:hypothetical protein